MVNYQFVYLPLFKQDLIRTSLRITDILGNADAANKLVDDVEKAIKKRSHSPKFFSRIPFTKKENSSVLCNIYKKLYCFLCCY